MSARVAPQQAEHNLAEFPRTSTLRFADAARDVAVRLRRVELAQRERDLAEQKVDIEWGDLILDLSKNFQLGVFEDDHVSAQNREVDAIIAYRNALPAFDRTRVRP